MQFRVPQFIDIEDKILGPLGWKQLVYCLGAAGVTYIAFRLIDSRFMAFLICAPFVAIFLSFAFLKINNQNFIDVAKNAVSYYFSNNLFLWRKDYKKEEAMNVPIKIISPSEKIHKAVSLRDLTSQLDTKVNQEN